MSISKVETGTSAPGGTYTFVVTGPQNFQVQVKAGETWTSGSLPLGTYTIVEENAPQGATIVPNPVTLTEDGQTVAVTATNPYPNDEVLGESLTSTPPSTALPRTGDDLRFANAGLALLGTGTFLMGLRGVWLYRRIEV